MSYAEMKSVLVLVLILVSVGLSSALALPLDYLQSAKAPPSKPRSAQLAKRSALRRSIKNPSTRSAKATRAGHP